jgi:hypothetical protein
MSDLKALYEKATARPWVYRPCEHDDWGFIRGPETQLSYGLGRPVVALARSGGVDFDADSHRHNNTDPYGTNAALIVHAVNTIEASEAEVERWHDAYEIAFNQAMSNGEAATNARDALTASEAEVGRLRLSMAAIKGLVGNVDHSKGHGANAAEMRGNMLNDIRDMASAALSPVGGEVTDAKP